jgi:citrate lyase subunit beta/citryl-CoA lyase
MLEKSRDLPADELVLDLEDAVAVEVKDAARATLADALRSDDWGERSIAVRVNATTNPHCLRDLVALLGEAGDQPASIVVPKVESAFDLLFVDRLAGLLEAEAGRHTPVGLQALIETPPGLRRIDEIVTASARLETLIIGYADLGAALGRPPATRAPDDRWLWVQETVLSAARSAGLQAIDGPWLAIKDTDGFDASCRRARELGFDGKWALHPTQIDLLNELFAPTAQEYERARDLLATLERAESQELRGAVMFRGEMIDEASRKHAQGIVTAGLAAGL